MTRVRKSCFLFAVHGEAAQHLSVYSVGNLVAENDDATLIHQV